MQIVTVIDDTPPVVTAPPAITVATDPGSATAVVADAALGSVLASDNSGHVTVARSGVPPGNVFPLGTTTITYTATDPAGNHAGATQTITVQDREPPSIVATKTPASPNADGWYATSVSVHFTCADNVHVRTCPSDVTFGEGRGQSVTGTAEDDAGNTASVTVSGINVDLTKPTIVFSGNVGTYTIDQTVAITCAADDALSGVATTTCPAVASGPAYSFGLGTHTLTATATDRAGNTLTATTTFTVNADETSLCALTRQLVTKAGVASSLCAKLDAAAAAGARGNVKGHDGAIGAYVSELEAQRDKSISGPNADVLIALARSL
jgi:hypothetical protein